MPETNKPKDKSANFTIGLRGDPDHARKVLTAVGNHIHEVFIAPPEEIAATGRQKQFDATLDTIREIRAITREHDVELNVLLNASCFGGQEKSPEFKEKSLNFLRFLEDIGVDATTVTNGYLLQLILAHRTTIKISLSTFMNVNNPVQARMFQDMGVERIIIVQSVNRDFEMLERIRDFVEVDLELYANSCCLFGAQCPCFLSHRHYTAHAVSPDEDCSRQSDPYLAWCVGETGNNLMHTIMSSSIRPEDLALYERIGYNHFKLALRLLDADSVIRTVQAYTARRWDGTIGELLTGHPKGNAIPTPPNHVFDGFLERIAYVRPEDRIAIYKEFYNELVPENQKIPVDNSLRLTTSMVAGKLP